MRWTRVVACDPGLATFGLAVVDTDGDRHEVRRVDVFESKPMREKDIDVADDRVRRVRDLSRWLARYIEPSVDVVAAEAMSFPRGTHAIACICLAWGALADQVEQLRRPIVCAGPVRWRLALTPSGKEKAAHDVAVKMVEGWLPASYQIEPKLRVHALDALGVFAWSLTTNIVRAKVMRDA